MPDATTQQPVETAYAAWLRYLNDRAMQALLNNLWGNNPSELERWADDGGPDV